MARKIKIPIALIGGVAAGLARPIEQLMQGQIENAANDLMEAYTGYSSAFGNFAIERLKRGLLPLVMGMLVHKFVGGPPLNVNKALASAGVPFIRI